MASFKVKLVAYFLLLSLLPIAIAFWGFTTVAGASESRRVDARLQAGLRSTLAGYDDEVQRAQARAEALARDRAFQLALQRHDVAALRAELRRSPHLYVLLAAGNVSHVGPRPFLAARRPVTVLTRGRRVGTVVGYVPLDRSLVKSLRARSGLASHDTLVLLEHGRIGAAEPQVTGDVSLPPGRTKTIRVSGVRYRTLVAPAVSGVAGARFAVLSPQSLIDAANSKRRDRLLIGLLVSLALVSLVAYFEGRSIVRTLRSLSDAANAIARGRLSERVPVRGRDEFASLGGSFNEMADQLQARHAELAAERDRVRDAIGRFGDALAATHDLDQLLRVIVEAVVEATGASGARLRAPDGSVVEAGEPDAIGRRLELRLAAADESFGTLVIVSPSFDEEQRMTAASLASHASIALENARLHAIVERQALVDGLTGIGNQRQCEEALALEIARADRLATSLTLVLADLDDFKTINDLHGHAAGDEVLREFAGVLRATVRETDLAGRWGGEEFLLLLPGADAAGGAQLAERVRASLGERSFLGRAGRVVRVSCSFGVAQHRPGADSHELFEAADRALYLAKRRGKNRVEVTHSSGAFSSLDPESPANQG